MELRDAQMNRLAAASRKAGSSLSLLNGDADHLRRPVRLCASKPRLKSTAEGDGAARVLTWDIFKGRRRVGHVGLDALPAEFDPILSKYCPALRVYVAPVWRGRGLATAATSALLALLRDSGLHCPLQASHDEDDEAASRLLSRAGFLYTGRRSRTPAADLMHMIALP